MRRINEGMILNKVYPDGNGWVTFAFTEEKTVRFQSIYIVKYINFYNKTKEPFEIGSAELEDVIFMQSSKIKSVDSISIQGENAMRRNENEFVIGFTDTNNKYYEIRIDIDEVSDVARKSM